MQEYERTETTVVNSYVRPEVSRYVSNLQAALGERMGGDTQLSILRSDGGLASARAAAESPVNLLMSGPAGGVAGAVYFCEQAGFRDILTFDMGGTSTDVALIQDARPRVRRETIVGDVRVRAPSVDVRTVGAGGGSIAFVPELTRALRVGPESAGAVPGPACYMKGGEEPTVCDANVVLGYLPSDVQLGGKMEINREASERPCRKWPTPWVSASWKRRRASSVSSTNRCSAPCAWSPWSRATTRETSPSWASAAPGRCTPTPSVFSRRPGR
jgi:N-methylhydantoinase A